MANEKHMNIDAIALLARIELTEKEKSELGGQLEQVLGYIDQLNTVDVSGVEPSAHAFEMYNVWDKDEIRTGFTQQEALRNAPAQDKGQVVVARVVEEA